MTRADRNVLAHAPQHGTQVRRVVVEGRQSSADEITTGIVTSRDARALGADPEWRCGPTLIETGPEKARATRYAWVGTAAAGAGRSGDPAGRYAEWHAQAGRGGGAG